MKHMQYPVKWYEPTHRIDVMAGTFLAGTFGDNRLLIHSTTKELSAWGMG
ncbi:hypothetical protein [Weissella sp. LMG 11983]|nr:hypothetical protein [Weissella sp. LMG 11983]